MSDLVWTKTPPTVRIDGYDITTNYRREVIVPSKTCNDGSFYAGCTQVWISENGFGWYQIQEPQGEGK